MAVFKATTYQTRTLVSQCVCSAECVSYLVNKWWDKNKKRLRIAAAIVQSSLEKFCALIDLVSFSFFVGRIVVPLLHLEHIILQPWNATNVFQSRYPVDTLGSFWFWSEGMPALHGNIYGMGDLLCWRAHQYHGALQPGRGKKMRSAFPQVAIESLKIPWRFWKRTLWLLWDPLRMLQTFKPVKSFKADLKSVGELECWTSPKI